MSNRTDPPNPGIKQDFNEAAKQQADKTAPFPSEKGISTKSELDKRTEIQRVLREKMERENVPKLAPKNSMAKETEVNKFQENKRAYEENEAAKNKIAMRLKQKKEQQMAREFNRAAKPSRD
jgi:hypothetical protein